MPSPSPSSPPLLIDASFYDALVSDAEYQYCDNATLFAEGGAAASSATITWDSVGPTSIFALTVGILCLFLYELYRRDPIVNKYVYDRRRLTQPERCPPPLMLSRSLWRGGSGDHDNTDDDTSPSTSRRCQGRAVYPAVLELLFINLDPEYLNYSRLANDASDRRESRRVYACCRTGRYHRNGIGNYRGHRRRASSSSSVPPGSTIDEDGYVFHPEYEWEYSHIYRVDDVDTRYTIGPWNDASPTATIGHDGPSSSSSLPSSAVPPDGEVRDAARGIGAGTTLSSSSTSSTKRKTAYDLFPEDDPRRQFATSRNYEHGDENGMWRKGSLMRVIESMECTTTPNGSDADVAKGDDGDDGDDEDGCRDVNSYDDIVENAGDDEDGRSMPPSGMVGRLTSASELIGNDDARVVVNIESREQGRVVRVDDGIDDGVIMSPPRRESNGFAISTVNTSRGVVSDRIAVGDESGRSSTDIVRTDVKYPYRLKYIFMPPGFHSWRSVIETVDDFFMLPKFTRLCRRAISRMPLSPTGHRRDDSFDRGVLPSLVGKELSGGEKELLRCAGLDTYLLIRFARFGFNATFYPFCAAFVFVLPLYHYSMTNAKNTLIPVEVEVGYLSLTINSIPDGSNVIAWIVLLTAFLYLHILRMLWIEWEVFIKLRHDFLARGDTHFFKHPTYLRKYQNTCIVQEVPKSHRSDTNLKDVFESLFPGQIEHAEMLIDTSKLERILLKRQTMIEKYDSIDAKYRYNRYVRKKRAGGSEPVRPMVKIGGLCSGKKQDALEYYNSEIKELEELASKEYDALVEARMKCHKNSLVGPSNGHDDHESIGSPRRLSRLHTLLSSKNVKKAFSENADCYYGTGIVTFNSIASKQCAVQCNLSGQPDWMITEDAPDPRDVFWQNIHSDRSQSEKRKILVQVILLSGIIGWSYFVSFIHKIVNESIEMILIEGEYAIYFKDVLPTWTVSLILIFIPSIFYALAIHAIRFKTHTEIDNFVLLWNTSYRIANIYVSFFVSADQAVSFFLECPDVFLKYLANGILGQAPYFMNLIILATGNETLLQLLQWRSLIKHALYRPLVNLNAKSRRYHDWLNRAPVFEESFIFGFFAPVLSYGLMIAMIFAFMVPSLLGVCALFFWTATKVHTHNALFVYCQRFEGGGKIFYYWNRIIIIILYSGILIFSGILALKEFPKTAIGFLLGMIVITYSVDKSIENTFEIHSQHLPISIARIHDEEEVALISNSQLQSDGGENFLYRHPILKHENWNSRHTWNFN